MQGVSEATCQSARNTCMRTRTCTHAGLTVLAPGSALVQRGIAELACTRLAGLHGDLHRAGTHADTSCSALRGYRAAAAAHPRMDAAQQARGSGACGAARLQRRDDTTLASDANRAHGPGPGIMGMGHALGTASAPPGAGGDVPQPHKGPWALFEQGLQHGRIRPDERQQVPMRHLQQLYVQLEKLYKKRNKPSNLTMVDSYATKQSSWYDDVDHLCLLMAMRARDLPTAILHDPCSRACRVRPTARHAGFRRC